MAEHNEQMGGPESEPHRPGVGGRGTGLFPVRSYLLDIGYIWVVFGWHEQQVQPLVELDPIKGGNSHVQKNTKEHSQGDLPEQVPNNYGETWGRRERSRWPQAPCLRDCLGKAEARAQRTHKQGNQQPRYPLLLDLLDLGLVPRCHSLAHDGECVGMSDGADGGSSQPGQAKKGTDAAHGHNKQEVQVEARALLQHALLLGDDQPEWGWGLADAQGPGASLAQSCLSRAPSQEPPSVFGTCPFRQDKHSITELSPLHAALLAIQDHFQPVLCPSQQTSEEPSTAYGRNSGGAWVVQSVKYQMTLHLITGS